MLVVQVPCQWGGVVDNKPMVAKLEEFGQRALNNLWLAIQKLYPDEVMIRKTAKVGFSIVIIRKTAKICFSIVIIRKMTKVCFSIVIIRKTAKIGFSIVIIRKTAKIGFSISQPTT